MCPSTSEAKAECELNEILSTCNPGEEIMQDLRARYPASSLVAILFLTRAVMRLLVAQDVTKTTTKH